MEVVSITNKKEKNESELKSYLKIILFAFIASFFITRFISPTLVSGESMYPTLNNNQYLIVSKISDIKRGDIVTFKNPLENNKVLIKRVIGLPGDKIEFKDGYVYRNGEKLNEPYINEPRYTFGATGIITVEPNKLFVLGDNRNNSLDSRFNKVGQVDNENIIGKASFSVYPFKLNIENK